MTPGGSTEPEGRIKSNEQGKYIGKYERILTTLNSSNVLTCIVKNMWYGIHKSGYILYMYNSVEG